MTEFGKSAINLSMQVWFKDRSDAYRAACEIREAIKIRFENEGIEMPSPYKTIVFKKNSNQEQCSKKPFSLEEIKIEYALVNRLKDTQYKTEEID